MIAAFAAIIRSARFLQERFPFLRVWPETAFGRFTQLVEGRFANRVGLLGKRLFQERSQTLESHAIGQGIARAELRGVFATVGRDWIIENLC